MHTLEIEKLTPLGIRNLWAVKFIVTEHLEIDHVPVQNVTQMTVAVQYPADGSISGLQQAAYDAARTGARDALAFIAGHELGALQERSAEASEEELFGFMN